MFGFSHLSISFNTAVLYSCQDQPWRGIAKGEDPTGDNDASCSCQCTDVLKGNLVIIFQNRQF